MKKVIKGLLVLIISILLYIPSTRAIEIENNVDSINNQISSSTPSEGGRFQSFDYVIDKYDVNIKVNENNTFDITETITAYFNEPRHGIIRTIPLKNTITRLDGTSSTNRAQVSNVSVDNEYTSLKENGYYKIKIGSASSTLTGKKIYVINYTYNIGKDPVKTYDELYYNIIGNEWETVIGNVTFSITMPKEFDASKLGFSSGRKGSIDSSKIRYSVDGNVISGSYEGILFEKEGLTVRCELPEGYFVGAKLNDTNLYYLLFFIPIICLIITILLWHNNGKDNKIVETVEFYPPDGLNSLEVGFLYKGRAENKDVISLLITLANKGYIEIIDKPLDLVSPLNSIEEISKVEIDKKTSELQKKIEMEEKRDPNSQRVFYYKNMQDIYKNKEDNDDYINSINRNLNKKNKFLIKKVKDYDGTDINEQWFMEGLFEYDKVEVTDTMLKNDFYVTTCDIKDNVNNKKNIESVFENGFLGRRILVLIMIVISFIAITMAPMLKYSDPSLIVFALVFPFAGYAVFIRQFFINGSYKEKVVNAIFGFICAIIPWIVTIVSPLTQSFAYFMGYIIGLICIVIMNICFIYIPKRTKYGNEMLGKIKGFKTFLKTAEKEKLESLVNENPNYFYDIIPYAYVLGISNKWIKKFESISPNVPLWYNNPSSNDFSSFRSFMNSTMKSANSAMSPGMDFGNDSSGGSGGGSSGGGSGGGGGSSW